MENDENTCPQGAQSEACVPEQPTAAGECAGSNSHEIKDANPLPLASEENPSRESSTQNGHTTNGRTDSCVPADCHDDVQLSPRTRRDKNCRHAARHGVLSRYPLGALAHLGENVRSLKRIERKFRAELKPSGILADVLFDRFFSCYLRCVLATRAEATAFAPIDQPAGESRLITSLKDREVPTLVIQDSIETSKAHLSADLLRQLALAARYDAHVSKEMYRALAMLLILRSGGEAALEQCVGKMLGVNKES